jgi:hypothetical protein
MMEHPCPLYTTTHSLLTEALSDNLKVFECVLILLTLRNRKRNDPTQGRSSAELRLQTVLAPEQLAPHRRSSWADVPPYAARRRFARRLSVHSGR